MKAPSWSSLPTTRTPRTISCRRAVSSRPPTVNADGLYEFNDLDEGAYVIVAKNTDDYEMYHGGPDMHYRNNVAAQTYGDVEEGDIDFPLWDYAMSTVTNSTSGPHPENPEPDDELFTFYNFALLHGDGEFSGRVREARGEPQGIAVELRRCVTTTLNADDDDVVDSCVEDTDHPAQTENAASSGRWDFGSLREGWYVVNVAATTYSQARFDDKGMVDDDAIDCAGTAAGVGVSRADDGCDARGTRTEDAYGMLEGVRAFNRGGVTFYVYNHSLPDDDELTGLSVEGTTDVDDGDEELISGFTVAGQTQGQPNTVTTVSSEQIVWSEGTVTLDADVSAGASVKITAPVPVDADGDPTVTVAPKVSGSTVTLGYNETGGAGAGTAVVTTVTVTVTAANGYNDHDYTFDVTRAVPVGNSLVAVSPGIGDAFLTLTDPVVVPTLYSDNRGFDVPVDTDVDEADFMVTLADCSQTLVVRGDDVSSGTALNADTCRNKRYTVDLGAPGTKTTVYLDLTSEDGVERTYYLDIRRTS